MFISHRINCLRCADDFPLDADGIEFDIRDCNGRLLVQHDAFQESGQPFEEFLRYCPPTKFYVVNVKAEGIEERAIAALDAAGITNFFLLDCSVPAAMKLARKGERRLAVRFSEVEPLESVAAMRDRVQWVWIDVFTRLPLTKEVADLFRQWNLRTCLVSPELQGQSEKLEMYIEQLKAAGLKVDAVCAKQWAKVIWQASGVLSQHPSQ